MQRLPVARHLSANQARAKYRSCRHPVERTRWHAIWLLLRADEPRTPAQVAEVVGLSVITVRDVLHRWNDCGPDGLADRRKGNGSKPRLTDAQRAELFAALKRRPPGGGLWTGPKVVAYVRDRWGCGCGPRPAGGGSATSGSPSRSPGPGTPGRRAPRPGGGGGKNLRRRLARLRRRNPGKRVEVWAEDEARLGLKPIARRVWSLRGRRPRSGGRTRYDWLYVYGFARPATGQTFTAILPRVNAERMGEALAAFAAHADPRGRKVLVLLVDRAGWHVAKRLAVPPGVVLHFLPPCTPGLQPVEPLWPLVREAVANRSIGRLERLRSILRSRLAYLTHHPEVVRPVVGFRWARRLER